MTILALDTAAVFASNSPLSLQKAAQTWSQIPRTNLRKRSCSSKKMNLDTVNSAFLSGLFADAAKAAADAEDSSTPLHPQDYSATSSPPPPSKKTRISKTKSMSRCGRSFKILTQALDDACGFSIPESPGKENRNSFWEGSREDSLLFQLDCVASSSPLKSSSTDISSATLIAFPHLPATVSTASHCGTTTVATSLTRVISDLQSSFTENNNHTHNEAYGWFVEMEDDDCSGGASADQVLVAPAAAATLCDRSLAFCAHTAPKAENYDAELEWATAADTVDDVLGDFF